MILEALNVIRGEVAVRKALASWFPWVLVDEYQDLGGPLHQLVTTLANDGENSFLAVGDPDQSIYGFAGANPTLFTSLASTLGFESIALPLNYRSGPQIVGAKLDHARINTSP